MFLFLGNLYVSYPCKPFRNATNAFQLKDEKGKAQVLVRFEQPASFNL